VARAGLGYVPESRGIFPSLSVRENLTVASRPARQNLGKPWSLERVFEEFPRLAERRNVGGGQLSGGEQQLLAIARALLGNCRVLLLDEPTEGLAPTVVSDIERLLMSLKASGSTILLVEQNYPVALRLADDVLVLGKGRLQWSGAIDEFETAHEVRRTWLGV
jgi:branched-chain amino acid transport system ATP-binding protein